MSKHTPGPWHIGMRTGHNANLIYSYSGKDSFHDPAICSVFGIPLHKKVDEIKDCEGADNAKLIARAPEMAAELAKLKAVNAELVSVLQKLVARVDANPLEAAGIALMAIEGRSILSRAKED